MASEEAVSGVFRHTASISKHPESFLNSHRENAEIFKRATKTLFDLMHAEFGTPTVLPELIVKDFDDEQIWQELQLQNQPVITELISRLVNVVPAEANINFSICDDENITNKQKEDEEEEEEIGKRSEDEDSNDEILAEIRKNLESYERFANDNSGDLDSESDLEDYLDEEEEEETSAEYGTLELEDKKEDSQGMIQKNKPVIKQVQKKNSKVDDKFFKLSEMEAFLEQQDQLAADKERSEGDDFEDIGMFEDIESETDDDNAAELRYFDFFDPPTENQQSKKVHFKLRKQKDKDSENSSEMEEAEDDTTKSNLLHASDSEGESIEDILGGKNKTVQSSFEKRQEKLKQKISKLEEASISDKPWQLLGEISALERPENSLLEEHVYFESTLKPPPEITTDISQKLEDLILQRIKDKAWDDVERKEKKKEEPFEYKKRIVLDQEKSKKSLGDIYEQEYLKQQQEKEEEKEDPAHEDIRKMMQSLFVKLDALSNFHYTPKLPAPEVKVVNNLPSITMEEVAPVSVSDATLLTPGEINKKQKGELKGKTEKTATDRKRERREKKKAKKMRAQEKEKQRKHVEKLKPGLGNKYSKEKVLREFQRQNKRGLTIITDNKKRGLTNSAKFFSQLQDDVRTRISSQKVIPRKQAVRIQRDSKNLKL